MFYQIWKDINGTDTVWGDKVNYRIINRMGGEVLYEGTANVYPDGQVHIPINKICAKYLDTSLQVDNMMTDGTYYHPNAYMEFYYEGNSIHSYELLNDWSYEEKNSGNRTLSEPINGHMAPNMKLLYTVFKPNGRGTICYEEL